MINKYPLVSICIPTYGRVEILQKTLDSIFSQNVDTEKYEVCISDNSPTDETKEMLRINYSDKKNIIYRKSKSEGYLNSIEALKLGTGTFLKLHNNYTNFAPMKLNSFIKDIEFIEETDNLLFFIDSIDKGNHTETFISFDAFMNYISYFSTWSSAFGIWKKDFDILISNYIELDKMFPHTSLLFATTEKKQYMVINKHYFDNQLVKTKGGYNLPETFGIRYVEMLNKLVKKRKLSQSTYNKIKEEILVFIAKYYANVKLLSNRYTYSFDGWKEVIRSLGGGNWFYKFYSSYVKECCKIIIKIIIRREQ